MGRPAWILVAGQFVSVIGDGLASVAVLWWVLQTTGSVALMASVAAILALAGLLASPIAGVWVDRLDRRSLMIVADGARAACYGAIALMAFGGRLPLWALVALLAVARVLGAAYFPALMASLPRLVGGGGLTRANGLLSFAQSGGQLLGSALGGVLIAAFGVAPTLGADALSFLVSAGSIALIAIPTERVAAAAGFRAEIASGLRYARTSPFLRALAGPSILINALTNGSMVLLPALAAGPLHAGAQGYGLLAAGFPLGTLLGSAAVGASGRSVTRAWTLYGMLVVMGGAIAMVGLSHALAPALAAMAVAGVVGAIANAAVYALMQSGIPDEFQGRVFSLLGGVSQGLVPISQAAAGAIAAVWSVGGVIAAAGAGVAATGLGFGWTGAGPVGDALATAGRSREHGHSV